MRDAELAQLDPLLRALLADDLATVAETERLARAWKQDGDDPGKAVKVPRPKPVPTAIGA